MKEALLDTDILSFYLKGDYAVTKKIREYLQHYDRLNISIITKYEVLGGLEYKQATRQISEFELFLHNCEVINLTDTSIRKSAKAYGDLRRKGITIGTSDLIIAGIAIEKDLELITNNEKHYRNIDGLRVSNWKID